MMGTDVSCPEIRAALCGAVGVRLVFNHNQMRQSELYWQYSTRGGVLGYMGICEQAAARTYVGLGAIAYGAAAAAAIEEGKAPLEMERFDARCNYAELTAAAGELMAAVLAAFPDGGGGRKKALRRAQRNTRGGRSSAGDCAPASR